MDSDSDSEDEEDDEDDDDDDDESTETDFRSLRTAASLVVSVTATTLPLLFLDTGFIQWKYNHVVLPIPNNYTGMSSDVHNKLRIISTNDEVRLTRKQFSRLNDISPELNFCISKEPGIYQMMTDMIRDYSTQEYVSFFICGPSTRLNEDSLNLGEYLYALLMGEGKIITNKKII